MKIAISLDSTADMPKDLIEKYKINVIPLIVNLDGKDYIDNIDINSEKILNFVDETGILPKTAANSIFEYEEYFNNILKEYDYVIHYSISSKISSSFNNAYQAGKDNDKIFVVDSKNLSSSISILALTAIDLMSEGKTAEEIYKITSEKANKLVTTFIVDKLTYLRKGGRCSALSLLGANILKIKPCIRITDGSMKIYKKYRGKINEVLQKYVKEILNEQDSIDTKYAFITYSSTEKIDLEPLQAILKDYGFENILLQTSGSVITCHCGRNALGVLFANK